MPSFSSDANPPDPDSDSDDTYDTPTPSSDDTYDTPTPSSAADVPTEELTDHEVISSDAGESTDTEEQAMAKASATSLGDQDAVNLSTASLPDEVLSMVEGRAVPTPQAVRRYPTAFPDEVVKAYSEVPDPDDATATDDLTYEEADARDYDGDTTARDDDTDTTTITGT